MKKKLDEKNRKIRHSRKKHDGMIHKRNSLRKGIETLKRGAKPPPAGRKRQNLSLFLRNLNKLSEELTEVIELRENPKWTTMHSLSE